MSDDLPPINSAFYNLPRQEKISELRAAGERQRREGREAAELAAIKHRRETPGPAPGMEDPDRPGLRQAKRFSWALAARAVPGLLTRGFENEVPADHVERDEQTSEATILCACGERLSIWPERSVGCACGRLFLDLGETVRVRRLPAEVVD